ncbi:hypothetical protein EST38_g4851 [Candolleomyces aberdarensis]|uniref:Phosphatidic acid phosphatase type 2/haloperoxidase domain-containing protein n=1 Tax=Candolleomyces aberdarensis TaxID=2316362 RepID=A0A4Q2DNV9_9AGAR|nr:hypothetical protein EST38_g4851 [Candolleomyces aberdarensis]
MTIQGRLSAMFQPSHPHKAPKVSAARRRKLLFSYAPDWVMTLLLAALFLSLDKIDGYRRVFSLDDTSLRHPYAVEERVPNVWLYIICGVVPLVLLPVINWFTVRSWWDLHNSWLGLTLGLALTGSVTQFVKITVGRPRPDIIDRCQPPAGAADPPFKLTDWTICTQTDNHMLRDGFRSFPSGHSSMSFAGLGFLSFYLAGKLHLFDKRGHAGKAWVSLFPFCGAALVAISRSMDYRHHWHDILVGSILGVILSFFAYRQYYPSLSSEVSHRPYSPRIKSDEDDGPTAAGGGILPLHLGTNAGAAGASSGFKPSGSHITPPSNRYSPSPSPPPAQHVYSPPGNQGYYQHHHQGSGSSNNPNPFVQNPNHIGSGAPAGYELDGTATVPRPQPDLSETWKTGAGGVEGTVPRSRSADGSSSNDDDADETGAAYGGMRGNTVATPKASGFRQHDAGSGLT